MLQKKKLRNRSQIPLPLDTVWAYSRHQVGSCFKKNKSALFLYPFGGGKKVAEGGLKNKSGGWVSLVQWIECLLTSGDTHVPANAAVIPIGSYHRRLSGL